MERKNEGKKLVIYLTFGASKLKLRIEAIDQEIYEHMHGVFILQTYSAHLQLGMCIAKTDRYSLSKTI